MKLKTTFIISMVFFMLLAGCASAVTEIPSGVIDTTYVISSFGETYVLTGDVTITHGTAFQINANNITIDGRGYSVAFDSYGVYADTKSNLNIKNIKFIDSTTDTTSRAIYGKDLKNSMFTDINASSMYSDVIYLTGASTENFMDNISVSSVNRSGVYLAAGQNTLNNVAAWSDSGAAMNIISPNNIITNSYGYSNSSNGIILNSGYNNTINNCTAVSDSGMSFVIQNTHDNTIKNCHATSNTKQGLYLYNCSYSLLENSVGTSESNVGVSLNAGSNNNSLINITGSTYSLDGIRIVSSINNTLSSCTGNAVVSTGFNGNGIMTESVYDTTFTACTGSARDGRGWLPKNTSTCTFLDCVGTSEKWLGIQLGIHGGLAVNNIFTNFTCTSPHATTGENQLLFFGDSITLGWADSGWTFGREVNNTLQKLGTPWTHISEQGVGGDRTDDAVARMDETFAIFHPDAVVIHLATNDMLFRGGPGIPNAISNISQIIDYTRTVGATPYLMEIIPCQSVAKDPLIIQYNTAIRELAVEKNVRIITAWDSIDLIPNNGIYDGFNASEYDSGGVHPTDSGYINMGKYISRNIDSWYVPYIGESLNSSVDPTGYITTPRCITSHDIRVPMHLTPVNGPISLEIVQWGNKKIWKEFSESATSTTHVIGDFTPDTPINIICDGVKYTSTISNNTGYVNWVYDGGYSEHTFETVLSANFTSSAVTGNAPLTIKFNDTTITPSYNRSWDFENDGVIDSTQQTPVHVYSKPGNYSVNFTVTNENGVQNTIKTDYIQVTTPNYSNPAAYFWYVLSYLNSKF